MLIKRIPKKIEHFLIGSWNKELDSFYDDIRNRVNTYMETDPGPEWDGVIEKHPD